MKRRFRAISRSRTDNPIQEARAKRAEGWISTRGYGQCRSHETSAQARPLQRTRTGVRLDDIAKQHRLELALPFQAAPPTRAGGSPLASPGSNARLQGIRKSIVAVAVGVHDTDIFGAHRGCRARPTLASRFSCLFSGQRLSRGRWWVPFGYSQSIEILQLRFSLIDQALHPHVIVDQ